MIIRTGFSDECWCKNKGVSLDINIIYYFLARWELSARGNILESVEAHIIFAPLGGVAGFFSKASDNVYIIKINCKLLEEETNEASETILHEIRRMFCDAAANRGGIKLPNYHEHEFNCGIFDEAKEKIKLIYIPEENKDNNTDIEQLNLFFTS